MNCAAQTRKTRFHSTSDVGLRTTTTTTVLTQSYLTQPVPRDPAHLAIHRGLAGALTESRVIYVMHKTGGGPNLGQCVKQSRTRQKVSIHRKAVEITIYDFSSFLLSSSSFIIYPSSSFSSSSPECRLLACLFHGSDGSKQRGGEGHEGRGSSARQDRKGRGGAGWVGSRRVESRQGGVEQGEIGAGRGW